MLRNFFNLTGRDLTTHERERGIQSLPSNLHQEVNRLLRGPVPTGPDEVPAELRVRRCRRVAEIATEVGADVVLVDGPDGWLRTLAVQFASYGIRDLAFAFLMAPSERRITRAAVEQL